MSEIKSNKISPRKGTTTTIGDSGDSVTISSGTTTTNAGTISTAGITGGTINNTTGSIEGLQQQVSWQTGSIKTSGFTASANEGYFCNTTSAAFTVTLPASPSAGDVIGLKDYADTFDTNNLTINANGNKIQGSTTNFVISVEGTAAILLYVDSTKGWLLVDQSKAADITAPSYIVATGGTVLTCGNFKTHVFTGPGTFTVCSIGNPFGGPNDVDYFVVAGGAGGGSQQGGGGGAGGFRLSNVHSLPSPTTSPLANPSGITVTAQGYPITVGGGGTGAPAVTPTPRSSNGNNSVFSTITSAAGGGAGGGNNCGSPLRSGNAGGSGGGSSWGDDAYNPPSLGTVAGGSGNTPPVSPPQGNNGGASGIGCNAYGGGGGGAGTAGGTPAPSTSAGGDGSYIADSFLGPTAPSYGTPGPVSSTRYFAGGGAGRSRPGLAPTEKGGFGGGGYYKHPGTPSCNSQTGVTNTGGGGGSVYPGTGGTGGSGIVIIRYKYQ
jgi:hypothetical protein